MFGRTFRWQSVLRVVYPLFIAAVAIVLILAVLRLVGLRSAAATVTHGLTQLGVTLLVVGILAGLFGGWWWWYRRKQRQKLSRPVGWLEALGLFYKNNLTVSGPGKTYWSVILFMSVVVITAILIAARGHVVPEIVAIIIYFVLLVGAIDSMVKADYGLTTVYEATFRVVEREKRFRWILWAYRNRTHVTSDAAAKLNGLMFLLSLVLAQPKRNKPPDEVRSKSWLSERLKRAMKDKALVDNWLTDKPDSDPIDMERARALAESFWTWALTQPRHKVLEVLAAFEMVGGWTELFDQHDIITLDELQDETAFSPELRLPAHHIRWAIEDCPTFEKPRAKLLGGVQVIGIPGFDVIRPIREPGVWTSDARGHPVCQERKLRPDLSLGQIRIQITIPKAETLSGPAVSISFVVFGRIRNPYRAIYEVDDWEHAVVQILLDFMRSLIRKLSFTAAYGNKDKLSTTVSRCAKGEPVTLEMEPDSDRVNFKPAEAGVLQALRSLRRFGFVITDMAITDVNPSDEKDAELLRIEYEADKRGKALRIKADAEAAAIDKRGKAYLGQGDLAAALVQQDTLTHLPPGAVVIIGGGQEVNSALTAELIGRKGKGGGGDKGKEEKEKGGKDESKGSGPPPPASK